MYFSQTCAQILLCFVFAMKSKQKFLYVFLGRNNLFGGRHSFPKKAIKYYGVKNIFMYFNNPTDVRFSEDTFKMAIYSYIASKIA